MKQRELGREYLQENVGAVDVDVASADLGRTDQVAPEDAFVGQRRPRWAMAMVNR